MAHSYKVPRTPLSPAGAALIVFVVSIGVELIRVQLHPGIYSLFANPRMALFASIVANVGYHLWNQPDTGWKTATSAFLTEAGMFGVLNVGLKLVIQILAAVVQFLTGITDGPSSF